MSSKPKVLFIYEHKYPHLWKDGLWAALKLLEREFEITYVNLATGKQGDEAGIFDFILSWGAFGSWPEHTMVEWFPDTPKGLCIGGTALPPRNLDRISVLFYETEWYKDQISSHPNIIHAFGVNTDIYWKTSRREKVWDFLTVGAFSFWKRQERILEKKGGKFAIGEIQQNNLSESMAIIAQLLQGKCAISDMVAPELLARIYHQSKRVYIPADINGGGERAVLEARACGLDVEVENDNPKLQELLTCPLYNHVYYADQLKKGILSCL